MEFADTAAACKALTLSGSILMQRPVKARSLSVFTALLACLTCFMLRVSRLLWARSTTPLTWCVNCTVS